MEKLYEIEFMRYTNCMRDTICNDAKDMKDTEYIHVGHEPFIVRESEIEKYKKWGGGFRVVRFVGNMINDV